MTWADQMRALVSLPDNCGTDPGWTDWSWYTETSDPDLLSVSFFMNPDLFTFVIRSLLLTFQKINDTQRCTSSFKYRNIDGRTPSFASLNMYLGWR